MIQCITMKRRQINCFLKLEVCVLDQNFQKEHGEEQVIANDIGREYILPIIAKQSLLANSEDSEYGYDVLDGINIKIENVKIYKVKKGDEIVLASDGYPELENTLEASEKILKEILKTDTLLINKFKSTKGLQKGNNSFDDRTYIRFVV